MKKFLQAGFMSALLLGSVATAANGQAFRTYINNDGRFDEGRHLGWYQHHFDEGRHLGWYQHHFDEGRRFDMDDRDRVFGMHRVNVAPGEIVSFNNRVADLRNDIARRVSQGLIGANEAARLNMRLDRIVAMENNFQASGGGLSASEMATLNARLSDTRVAVFGSGRWF